MQEEKTSEPWWLDIKAGGMLVDAERKVLDDLLPSLYGYHLVQCAPPRFASFVSASLISHKVLINAAGNSHWPCSILTGDVEQLAILHDSVDVFVLTHSLESATLPHQVLREAHRCLIPEGHIVITGINPFSWWGMLTFIHKLFNRQSKTNMISPNRVKDWLKLLDFDIIQTKMFYFRPPLPHRKLMDKLGFLEKIGQKFWPFFGGAFAIVAVKKIVGITPIKPKFIRREPQWDPQGIPGGASYKRDNKS